MSVSDSKTSVGRNQLTTQHPSGRQLLIPSPLQTDEDVHIPHLRSPGLRTCQKQNNVEITITQIVRCVSHGTPEKQTKRRAAAQYLGHVARKNVNARDRVHQDRLAELRIDCRKGRGLET